MAKPSRTRRILTALGIGYLGLAAWNGHVYRRTRGLRFPLPLNGEAHTYNWPGGSIFYTQRGQGEPVLLVHGIYAGADSYEFRQVFEPLSTRYQVYAYDLLGFGHSARPNVRYSGPLYVRLLTDFVRDVIGRPTSVIATSLSGGHAILAANEERNLIRRLVLVNPTGRTDTTVYPSVGRKAAYLALTVLPDLGEAVRNLIAARAFIRWYLSHQTFHNRSRVTENLVDYYYRSAHQPGGEHALIAFLTEHLNVPVDDALRALPQPVSLFWGRHARVTPLNQAWHYLTIRPDATLHVLDEAGLDAINDQPEEFLRQVLNTLAGAEMETVSREALERMAPQRG